MEETSVSYSWQGPDKIDKERKVDWYWAVILIAIAGAVLSFMFNNFLLGVFVILATTLIFFFSSQKPKMREYKLDEQGLHINNHLTPYTSIKGFWLEETKDHNKLFLETNDTITPIISIFYPDVETGDNIYEILIEKVEQKPMVEPLSQQIFEKLGF